MYPTTHLIPPLIFFLGRRPSTPVDPRGGDGEEEVIMMTIMIKLKILLVFLIVDELNTYVETYVGLSLIHI